MKIFKIVRSAPGVDPQIFDNKICDEANMINDYTGMEDIEIQNLSLNDAIITGHFNEHECVCDECIHRHPNTKGASLTISCYTCNNASGIGRGQICWFPITIDRR